MIKPTNLLVRKVLYSLLSIVFVSCNTFCSPVASSALTDSQFFDAQEVYGKRVQHKTASANKHNETNAVHSSRANVLSKSNKSFFKSKTFNNTSPKTAQKQFQVQYRFGNSYNVKQFGAKGDGITDDQSAINSAISRATGTGLSVYFPPGNYLHSGLIVANGVALYGAGSSTTLTATNNTSGTIELTGDGPSLSNLIVQYANPIAAANTSYPDTAPQAGAVWVQSANTFFVSQVTILNSSQNDIDVFQSNNGNISSNLITTISTMWDGMQIMDCNNVQMLNNNFQYGGQDYYSPITFLFGTTGSQNFTIAYNQLQATGSAPAVAIYVTGLQSSRIDYNYFNNNATAYQYGIDIYAGNPGYGGYDGPASNLEISGNTLNDIQGSGFGIYMDDQSSNNNINNIQITNNKLNVGYAPIGAYYTGDNINIQSNTCNNCYSFIYYDSYFYGNNVNISSNIISNCSYPIADYFYGSVAIISNTFINCYAPLYNDFYGSTNISSNTFTNCHYSFGRYCYFGGNNNYISSNTFTNCVYGMYLEGNADNDINVSSNIINTVTGGDGLDIYNFATLSVQNNTLGNITNHGIYFTPDSATTTSAIISSNNLSNCCITSGNVIDVEIGTGSVSGLSIQNNNYAGPANNATYYIQSLVPGSATNPNISGNTQSTVLPNNLAP